MLRRTPNRTAAVYICETTRGTSVYGKPVNDPIDIETLDARHRREEFDEAERIFPLQDRPLRVSLPKGGRLPVGAGWLARLYAGERVPREKKPLVVDHLRSAGPFMVSIDEPPLSVIDAMSQTATFPDGFASPLVVRAYTEGAFGAALLHTGSAVDAPAADAFADALRAHLPELGEVSFAASGAEANERALAICHQQHPNRRRVLAFEGSFHGRTLLSLSASYNPSKRAPYEIAGYEACFAPFPAWLTPGDEPPEPAGWREAAHRGEFDDFMGGADALLDAEARSLSAVHELLSSGEFFAVLVEPMQCEGGDRYATARFHRALRLLTRAHDVPLILDEVQTGFGLGGSLAWHHRFGYVDRNVAPDGPDLVTFAKRAQVGVVMSRWPDPEPTLPHGASAIRGRLHLQAIDADHATWVGQRCRAQLAALQDQFGHLVADPRATGYAAAFELPTKKHLAAYLAQRFWRGSVVFGAGTRTVRYRFNRAFDEASIERVFEAARESLAYLEAHLDAEGEGPTPPTWKDSSSDGGSASTDASLETRVRVAEPGEAEAILDAFVALEARVYEPERRDSREKLATALFDPGGVTVIAEAQVNGCWQLVGGALGAPLERVHGVAGVDDDPFRPLANTIYALSTTLDPAYRGHRLGYRMKRALVEAAARLHRPDGSPRYQFLTGRMRVGATGPMQRINARLGATIVRVYANQYGGEGQAAYYRMPLRHPIAIGDASDPVEDWSDVTVPLREAPATLRRLHEKGALYGPAVHKLTLVNYVTPAIVRALEHVSALTPAHPHLFLSSSRAETFDKSLRILRHHRPAGVVAVGFEGGYVGHATAAARSLSDPKMHRGGPAYFDRFRRVPHPADDPEVTVRALRELVATLGADTLAGLWIEPVQERTGRVVPDEFWVRLAAFRAEHGVPVVSVETATAYYRSGRGPLHGTGALTPDLVVWYAGGQVGFVHVTGEFHVPTPLTMVSTWDGDELSLLRAHHRLRAAREAHRVGLDELEGALDAAFAPLRNDGVDVRGRGLLRVADLGESAADLAARLRRAGHRVGLSPGGALVVAPPLDVELEAIEAFGESLASCWGHR